MSDHPTLKIFIGWDSTEPITFAVLAHSILRRASRPVAIVPLVRGSLQREYTRPRQANEATEFSLTRFLVPYLSGFAGVSIFMDSDMLCRVDIGDIFLPVLAQPEKAVWCCQHDDYAPAQRVKFAGHRQTSYPRKNWSSVMVFQNDRCRALTPSYINNATAMDLHRFRWLHDDEVGTLPLDWNHLVGEYEPNAAAKLLHYTNGAPCHAGYEACDHADEWWDEYRDLLRPGAAVDHALRVAAARGVA